jgi:hypothetical protein
MATQLEQTKRTIATMKAAGFKRDEYSVRTPLDRKRGEYKSTVINLRCRFDPTRHDVQKLVDGDLEVTQYVGFNDDRSRCNFNIRYGYKGKFIVVDFTDKNEYGWAKEHRII